MSNQGNRSDLKEAGSKLTRKQKAYADYKLKNPKASNTEAVLQTYNTLDRATASVIATENEQKPAVISYLSKHSENIEQVLTDNFYRLAVSDELDEVKEGNRLGMFMHDKIHGKATNRVETTNQTVTISLDLTGNTE